MYWPIQVCIDNIEYVWHVDLLIDCTSEGLTVMIILFQTTPRLIHFTLLRGHSKYNIRF
jgi:hypothetical protein